MTCNSCGKSISTWSARYGKVDTVFCKECFGTHEAEKVENQRLEERNEKEEKKKKYSDEVYKVILTTESHLNDVKIQERFGIVTSECVLGMNIFRDIFANFRDVFGGQSLSSQKVLEDLKEKALMELRNEAYLLGANAVIAVDLDYSEFSGGGKSMLFLVASGTAVTLDDNH